tara:strand:+ start:1757 stop:2782 length:1026 start_codon:yes stop_codon:yes gene_type:complete
MKNLYALFIVVLLTANVFAQAPEKMSYQAVVRDPGNALVTTQAVGMQISILQGGATGTAVYIETQTPSTNINGLVSIEIGSGTVVLGTFNTIDWNNGPYFIKAETDPTGGATYTITGTSQLMSVPYALHANTADSIIGGATQVTAGTNVTVTGTGTTASPYVVNATSNSGHYLGELFGGGIVYYVYDNGAHGLIASLDDLDGGIGVAWSGNTFTSIGVTAQSFYDGSSNTAAMVTQDATPNKAGTLCDSYSNGGYSDWYLPASWELNLLFNSAFLISNILDNDGNSATQPLLPDYVAPHYGIYWSSTERNTGHGWYYSFSLAYSNFTSKSTYYRVRAVRAF